MPDHAFSIIDALLFGWSRFRDNAVFLLLLGAGLMLLTLIANSLQKAAAPASLSFFMAYLVFLAVNAFTSFVLVAASLELHDFGTIEIGDLAKALPQFLQFLGGYIIFCAVIMAGYMLLIIPGIFLTIKLFLYMYLVVDRKMNAAESLKKSYELTTGHFAELLIFFFSVVVINVLGMLLLGVGMLVSIPVTSIAGAYIYRKLASRTLT